MRFFIYAGIALPIYFTFVLTTQAQTSATAIATDAMSTGVVKKIDAQQGKVTINHGPLINLDMPAMTMVFRVAEPKLLDNLKADDKIQFIAIKKDGALTIVRLEQANSPAVHTQPVVPTPPSNLVITPAPLNDRNVQTPVVQTPVAQVTPATTTGSINPAEATARIANPIYKSVFEAYQPWQEITETPGQKWRAANDEMGRLGGHAGQLRDDAPNQRTPSAQTSEATMPMEKENKNKKPMPKHDMTNMNQGK